MKKIKTYFNVSIDGFWARVDGNIGWAAGYLPAGDPVFVDFLETIDSVLLSRRHYNRLQRENLLWPFGERPLHVISRDRSFFPDDERVNIVPDNGGNGGTVYERIGMLCEESGGGDIWLAGDHELISQLLERGMVDEITLIVLPVTLGNGLPFLLGNSRENHWTLIESQQYDTGLVRLHYRKRNV